MCVFEKKEIRWNDFYTKPTGCSQIEIAIPVLPWKIMSTRKFGSEMGFSKLLLFPVAMDAVSNAVMGFFVSLYFWL